MAQGKQKHDKKITTKNYQGVVYVFKDGVADIPGMFVKGKPARISINEFKRITGNLFEEPL